MSKEHFKGSTLLNPVPVVLVTSIDNENNPNVFTAAWVGTACTKPPIITLAIRPERLSYKNIKESMEFVVNLPSSNLVSSVDFCGVRSGRDIDKIKHCNFTLEASSKIKTPIIEECPVNLECKVTSILPLGSHDLFLAEVLEVQVDSSLIDKNGRISLENAGLLSYCHGEYHTLNNRALGTFGYSVRKKAKKRGQAK